MTNCHRGWSYCRLSLRKTKPARPVYNLSQGRIFMVRAKCTVSVLCRDVFNLIQFSLITLYAHNEVHSICCRCQWPEKKREQVSKLPQFSSCILQIYNRPQCATFPNKFIIHFEKNTFSLVILTNVFINLRMTVNDSPNCCNSVAAFYCWLQIQIQIQIQIQTQTQIQIQIIIQQISFQIAAILSRILPLTADNRWQCATFNFLITSKFN